MKSWALFWIPALLIGAGLYFWFSKGMKELPPLTDEQKLVLRGRAVYQAHCTSCHSVNPKMAGGIGPEVWGSSHELLEARILRAAYPDGYQPKRPTSTMVALPQLRPDIPALHAYLNAD